MDNLLNHSSTSQTRESSYQQFKESVRQDLLATSHKPITLSAHDVNILKLNIANLLQEARLPLEVQHSIALTLASILNADHDITQD